MIFLNPWYSSTQVRVGLIPDQFKVTDEVPKQFSTPNVIHACLICSDPTPREMITYRPKERVLCLNVKMSCVRCWIKLIVYCLVECEVCSELVNTRLSHREIPPQSKVDWTPG